MPHDLTPAEKELRNVALAAILLAAVAGAYLGAYATSQACKLPSPAALAQARKEAFDAGRTLGYSEGREDEAQAQEEIPCQPKN